MPAIKDPLNQTRKDGTIGFWLGGDKSSFVALLKARKIEQNEDVHDIEISIKTRFPEYPAAKAKIG
jgi:hypothetical protein